MKFSELLNKNNYAFLGTCVEIDWDATEMAQMIEKAKKFPLKKIVSKLGDSHDVKLRNLYKNILKNEKNFECGKNKEIVFIYDIDKDIHYFFEELL